ncbi:ABC transporter ATP-binding protein [Priestia taiwanensis]|uniref:ABC transporter ATP-binding protein n=1 Tax=Priestia taiwanensis TaxID=1347902 RepID=A0A917ESL5_9BACI|nr:ABC transporter ATP-binding protein [Priestia taiwanensis]MBM7364955.1 ABC-2 type transport system ATP-binding protein [Priestia taiwanensis]GGE82250.1 ABC transporter ATP-binding protein [Priestia taiwanensis]
MTSANIIEVNNVTKNFGTTKAVQHISFSIQKGSIVSLLGPNGAGKTTTISMMLGLVQPTSGTVEMFGENPTSLLVRQRFGAMLQQVSFIDNATVGETIDLFRSYYKHALPKRELLQLAGLEKEEKVKTDKLSGGQKRRLNFALAMAGDPEILFLDEPTVGMDVTSRQVFWERMEELTNEGKTIILTTHYLEEIEKVSDRIIMMNDGEIIEDGTPQQLKNKLTKKAISCVAINATEEQLKSLAAVIDVKKEKERWVLYTDNSDATLLALTSSKLVVSEIQMEQGGIEEVYKQLLESGRNK